MKSKIIVEKTKGTGNKVSNNSDLTIFLTLFHNMQLMTVVLIQPIF